MLDRLTNETDPAVAPGPNAAQRRIDALAIDITFELLGETYHCSGGPGPISPRESSWNTLLLNWAGEKIGVFTEVPIMPMLARARGYGQDCEGLCAFSVTVLCRHLLDELFDACASVPGAGGTVSIIAATQSTEKTLPDSRVVLYLRGGLLEDRVGCLVLVARPAVLDRLCDLLETVFEPKPVVVPETAERTLSLRSPGFEIARAEFEALQLGDVIMFDPRWSGFGEGYVWIDDQKVAEVAQGSDHVFRMADGFTSVIDQTELGEADTVLSVEFERVQVKAAEFDDTGAAAPLPFQGTAPETVEILADNKTFAVGALVDVDGQSGLRIVKILKTVKAA